MPASSFDVLKSDLSSKEEMMKIPFPSLWTFDIGPSGIANAVINM